MSNVISLAGFKKKKDDDTIVERREESMDKLITILGDIKEKQKEAKEEALKAMAFAERRNAENAERVRKERENNNKSVLRAYRIKH